MRRAFHYSKIQTKCSLNLIVVRLTWKFTKSSVHKHVRHHQTMQFGAHEIKWFPSILYVTISLRVFRFTGAPRRVVHRLSRTWRALSSTLRFTGTTCPTIATSAARRSPLCTSWASISTRTSTWSRQSQDQGVWIGALKQHAYRLFGWFFKNVCCSLWLCKKSEMFWCYRNIPMFLDAKKYLFRWKIGVSENKGSPKNMFFCI